MLYRTHRFYLRENENAVLLGNTYFSPFEWQTMTGCALDCSEAAAVHAAKQQISRDGKGTVECYFGRIDDPAIETVAVSIQEVTYDQGQEIRRELRRLTAGAVGVPHPGRTDLFLADGGAGWGERPGADHPAGPHRLGEDGTVVAEFTIRQESFASYG